jgi:hypothetical protein
MPSSSEKVIKALGVVSVSAVLCLFSIGIQPALAVTPLIQCTAILAGTNEVPPNVSLGTGSIIFTFDSSTSTSTWSETFSGLTTPATAAHIHAPALPGVNIGVAVPLTGVPAATSGSFSGTTTVINSPLTPTTFAAALLAGMAYANLHSTTYPGGEIRGQLSCHTASSVPEFSGNLAALTIAALLLPVIVVLRRQLLAPFK